MKFKIYHQKPIPRKKPYIGEMNISAEGNAYLAMEDRMCWTLNKIRLETMGLDGMKISGMEEAGCTKMGQLKYKYQEWWCVPV